MAASGLRAGLLAEILGMAVETLRTNKLRSALTILGVVIAAVGGAYLTYNLLFACGYFLCGPDALAGTSARTAAERLAEAFFFSVHTSATIGYGSISPRGLAANLLVTVEAFFGLLTLALATGVLFSRFARPSALPGGSPPAGDAPEEAAKDDGQAPSSEPPAPIDLSLEPVRGALRGLRFECREELSLLG